MPRPRRTHKKSRNGCAECKRRHVKCDEKHPTCVQCATSQLCCSFGTAESPHALTPSPRASSRPTTSPIASFSRPLSSHRSPNHTVTPTGASSNTIQALPNSTATEPEDTFSVNTLHLHLMLHFSTETSRTITVDHQEPHSLCNVVLKAGLSAPYLLHEILALAALHLSVSLPAQRGYYHHQASGLQTRALSLLNSSHLEIDAENCIAVVMFSWLLAIHSLCDLTEFRNEDVSTFLDGYISSLNLHRGVRAVARHSWYLLRQTDLLPVLEDGEAFTSTGSVGKECDGLRALLDSVDLGQASIKACETAIDYLQTAFDMERISGGRTDAIMIWPAVVPADYMDLLMKRSPEALVILAYYAVLLHNHHELWFIGNCGQSLVDSITCHLGPYWDSWLAWPNAVLQANSPSASQSPRTV